MESKLRPKPPGTLRAERPVTFAEFGLDMKPYFTTFKDHDRPATFAHFGVDVEREKPIVKSFVGPVSSNLGYSYQKVSSKMQLACCICIYRTIKDKFVLFCFCYLFLSSLICFAHYHLLHQKVSYNCNLVNLLFNNKTKAQLSYTPNVARFEKRSWNFSCSNFF